MNRSHRSVLITGASSGIGRGLALAYASPGVRLALTGRNKERLSVVSEQIRRRGGDVDDEVVDVRDQHAMATWVASMDDRRPLDLVIANAGITTGLGPNETLEDPDAVRAIIATNLIGVLNTVEPCAERMMSRGKGHVALIGSIAGLHGLPYSPAYCITKAGVHAYAESIRARLERRGVLVSLVIAGFVKTPLNDSISAMKPGELSEENASALIKKRLARGDATIAFPRFLYLAARLGRLLPARIYDQLMLRVEADVPHTGERI